MNLIDANPASALGANKARQAAGHPNWMRHNREFTQLPEKAEVLPVLVTPVSRAEAGAFPHLADVAFWPLDQFRAWARQALGTVRNLRRTLREEGDLVWRAQAHSAFEQERLDAPSLLHALAKRKASDALTSVF
jgi:hypothetical protein